MYRRWLALALIAVMVSTTSVWAEVRTVDPFESPETVLSDAEAQQLQTLQDITFPSFVTEISPDDTTLLIGGYRYSPSGLAFLNIKDGSLTPVQPFPEDVAFEPVTEVVWVDNQTVVFIALDYDTFGLLVIAIDRESGQLGIVPIGLPVLPLSLAPNGSHALVLLPPEGVGAQSAKRPTFEHSLPHRGYERPAGNPATYDADLEPRKFADEDLPLGILDLNSGQLTPITVLPAGSDVSSFAWTPDGSKFAMVRTTFPAVDRDGERLSSAATQDGLGLVPPDENPFFTGNVVDVYDLSNGGFSSATLAARDGNGDIFGRVDWSTDGATLMAQMWEPSRLSGRKNPVYITPQRSYLRFYDGSLNLISTFSAPEIEAPTQAIPTFVSPDEVMIIAPYGADGYIYYYNRGSGEFRAVTSRPGTYYQMRYTRQSRQLVFNYSSFNQAYDIFRLGWDGVALAQLTWSNDHPTQANNVRADRVSFTLSNGIVRSGYLVQPAGAAFPPQNVPLVVWQEGGPGPAMTNQWGSNVENPYSLLPNYGTAVLMVPLAGREGLGMAGFNALADGTNFGQVDIDEGAEIVKQMIARGYTSSGKVGVVGCSYGGYFTSQSITRHPDLYAAANTQCTLLDLFYEWQFGYTGFISYLEGRAPTAEPGEYSNDSPAYNAAKVRTPTLIFHGEFDFLPVSLAVNFHDQIEANGTPTEMLQFLYEGHGLGFPTNQYAAAQQQILWFRQHLTGDASVARATQSVAPAAAAAPAAAQTPAAKPAAAAAPAVTLQAQRVVVPSLTTKYRVMAD